MGGSSKYLLFVKFNDYLNVNDGKGQHRLVLLDPQDQTEFDRKGARDGQGNPLLVMGQVQSILAPTSKGPAVEGYQPRTEWCVNIGVFDPSSASVYANNEDSIHYRWHLLSNSLIESFVLDSQQIEAYTPTSIGPDGAIYAINKGRLIVIEEARVKACRTWHVRVASNSFAPQLLQNVRRGDTIVFQADKNAMGHNVVQTGSQQDCSRLESGFFSGPQNSEDGFEFELRVTLTGGTYHYMCQPHCTTANMRGSFSVLESFCCGQTSPDNNFDGRTNLLDLIKVIDFWGECSSEKTMCPQVDFNCDGRVNLEEMLIVIAGWTPSV